MEQSAIGVLTLVIILMGVMVILSIIAVTYLYRYFNKLFIRQHATINMMREDLNALCSGAVGVGAHIARLEKQSRRISRRQFQMELREMQDRNFDRAKILLRKGITIDQVISDCKLAKGEADLVKLANRMDNHESLSN